MTNQPQRPIIALYERIPLINPQSGLPAAYIIVDGGELALEITSRHRGEHVVTTVKLGEIKELIEQRLQRVV